MNCRMRATVLSQRHISAFVIGARGTELTALGGSHIPDDVFAKLKNIPTWKGKSGQCEVLVEKEGAFAVVGLKEGEKDGDAPDLSQVRESIRNAAAAGSKALKSRGFKTIKIDGMGDDEG